MSDRPRLLVTGAAGFLGWAVCQEAAAEWDVVGTVHNQPRQLADQTRPIAIELTDGGAPEALLDEAQPDAVIHCAAVAAPNRCQEDPVGSRRVNVDATVALARECARRGIRFAFISTDLVFDGNHAPYTEEAVPHPLSEYGRQKREAERRVLDAHPASVVCRLPLMTGITNPAASSSLTDFLKRARGNEPITLFTDEYRTPLDATSAARGCLLALTSHTGIIHLGGPERLSRYDLGRHIAEAFGIPLCRLTPCRQADVPMPAPRPADVSLDSSLAISLGFSPTPIGKALQHLAACSPETSPRRKGDGAAAPSPARGVRVPPGPPR